MQEDFAQLRKNCVRAGVAALVIAPGSFLLVAEVERAFGESEIAADAGSADFVQFYVTTLFISLPVSIPCAVIFSMAAFHLRLSDRLNVLTAAALGAALGILARLLLTVILAATHVTLTLDAGALAAFACTGVLTAVIAYLFCLRRATAP